MQEKPVAHRVLCLRFIRHFAAKSEDRECPIEQELFDWSPASAAPF